MKRAFSSLGFGLAFLILAGSASAGIRFYRVNEETFARKPVPGSTVAEMLRDKTVKIYLNKPSVEIRDHKVTKKNGGKDKSSILVSNMTTHHVPKKVEKKTPSISGILVSNFAAQKAKNGKNQNGSEQAKPKLGIPVKNLVINDGTLQLDGAMEVKSREDGFWIMARILDIDEAEGITFLAQHSDTLNFSARGTIPAKQTKALEGSLGIEVKQD